jgi:hypothetical protein
MISYAGNHKDVLLTQAFPELTNGFYVDVRANDPVWDSATKHFYDRGWRGINIEPVQSLRDRLKSHPKNDINLNAGSSNRETRLELTMFPANPGFSTFSPCMADF